MLLDAVSQTMGVRRIVAGQGTRPIGAGPVRPESAPGVALRLSLEEMDVDRRAFQEAPAGRRQSSRCLPGGSFKWPDVQGTRSAISPAGGSRNSTFLTGRADTLLDIGCNWGRWSASRRRGSDIRWLESTRLSAPSWRQRRVARSLGVEARFAVADGRFLPFPAESYDQAFCTVCSRHLSRIRCGHGARGGRQGSQARRGQSNPDAERTRSPLHVPSGQAGIQGSPWVRSSLLVAQSTTGRLPGEQSARLGVVGRLLPSTEVQASDIALMTGPKKVVLRVSEALKAMSRRVPLLGSVADSLYVTSRREPVVGTRE